MKQAQTRLGILAFVSVLIAVCPAAGQPLRVIPAAQALEDVRLARRAVATIHPGLDRYTARAEVDGTFDALEAACVRDITEREFYAGLSIALARIRCSHTKAEVSPGWAKWRKDEATYLPLRVEERAGALVVMSSEEPSIRPGDELLAVNGVPAFRIVGDVLAMTPADGFTDGARRFALGNASDLDSCEFDHYLPAIVAMEGRARLEVRSAGAGAARSVECALVKRDTASRSLNLDEAVSLSRMQDGVAVLRVDTFVAYRKKIKPEDVYRPHFEALRARSPSALILDLRSNGGGSDSAARDLWRFLCAEPFVSTSRLLVRTHKFGDLAPLLETWDRTLLSAPDERFEPAEFGLLEFKQPPSEPLSPLEPGYHGPLVVLCGPGNASGTTMFLASLRARPRTLFVGEPTGGAVEGPTAGTIFFLKLPHTGVRVRIPAIRTVTAWKAPAGGGGGFVPDIVVSRGEPSGDAGDATMDQAIEAANGLAALKPAAIPPAFRTPPGP